MSDNPTTTINLSEREEGNIGFATLGLNPYILLTVDDVTEATDGPDAKLTLGIEVGGGTPIDPVEDLVTFLEFVVEALREVPITPVPEDDADTEA